MYYVLSSPPLANSFSIFFDHGNPLPWFFFVYICNRLGGLGIGLGAWLVYICNHLGGLGAWGAARPKGALSWRAPSRPGGERAGVVFGAWGLGGFGGDKRGGDGGKPGRATPGPGKPRHRHAPAKAPQAPSPKSTPAAHRPIKVPQAPKAVTDVNPDVVTAVIPAVVTDVNPK